jgi:hypothetical protein
MSASSNVRDDDEAFFRSVMLPEEDRRRLTSAPWSGGFRWFRSPNVIDLEKYRRRGSSTAKENPRGE